MAFNIEQLRSTGKPEDQAYANVLQSILDARGEDFPLPTANTQTHEHTPDNEMRLSNELTVPALGFIALADSREAALTADNRDHDILLDRTAETYAKLQDILLPFINAANLKVPLASENKPNWRGKLKKSDTATWHYSDERNGKLLHYKFEVPYVITEQANIAQGLSLKISTSEQFEKHYYAPTIAMKFHNDAVSELNFRDSHVGELRQLITGSPSLGRYHTSTEWENDMVGGHVASGYNCEGTIELNPHDIIYTLKYLPGINYERAVIRQYDPESDSYISKHDDLTKNTVTFGEPTNKDDVELLIQSIIGLIPIMKQS